jgi:hypothetical protein
MLSVQDFELLGHILVAIVDGYDTSRADRGAVDSEDRRIRYFR